MSLPETSLEIEVTATDWAVRVENCLMDEESETALTQWLGGNSRRVGAYARARAICVQARRAKALGVGFDPTSYNYVGHMGITVAIDSPIENHETPLRSFQMTRRMMAGSVGMAAIAGGAAIFGFASSVAAHDYKTGMGEIKLVPLKGGLSATLNTQSSISVRYRSDANIVGLLSGEVLFDVPQNLDCLCIVMAGGTRITARDASFTVRYLANGPVAVLVKSGNVSIGRTSQPEVRRINANVRAVMVPNAKLAVTALAPQEIARDMAWREGMLGFEDTPLTEAAAEFARFSEVEIKFGEVAIGHRTVSGYFAANNPVGFAKAVALSMGLRAVSSEKSVTLLS